MPLHLSRLFASPFAAAHVCRAWTCAAVIGFGSVSLVSVTVESGTNALFVCYAEDPAPLATISAPLYALFIQHPYVAPDDAPAVLKASGTLAAAEEGAALHETSYDAFVPPPEKDALASAAPDAPPPPPPVAAAAAFPDPPPRVQQPPAAATQQPRDSMASALGIE